MIRIDLAAISFVGRDLRGCEGVMVSRDGTIWAADGRGGCTRLAPDGAREERIGQLGGQPNGICVDADGRIIVANIGAGSVQRLDPATGRHEVLATHAGGRRTTTPNFPFMDRQGRLWVSNSTSRAHFMDAVHAPAGDGFLFRLADGRAEVVAEDLWLANGVAVDAGERHVYVAESMKARVTRFPIRADALGPREPYGPDLGMEFAPDGIAFDEAGNLWVVCPGANALGVITPAGAWEVAVRDPGGSVLKLPTNICFGGADRRTAYIGNLSGPSLPTFRVPHPGLALLHQL